MSKIRALLLGCGLTFCLLSPQQHAYGKGGEGWATGLNFHLITAGQSDMNKLITRANSAAGGITTPQLGNAYEFSTYIHYRFSSSMIAFQFRPSFFYQQVNGSSSSAEAYNYGLMGFTFMPMLRWYLLESTAIRFFINTGLGYGILNGEIKEASNSIKFSGGNVAYLGGMGVEFCYESHCLNIEGNFRYLYIERNIASSATATGGAFSGTGSLTQASGGSEVELDSRDLSTSMSGVLGTIGYMYYF